MNILHAYLFFSVKYAGGTSDLMYKIVKAQIKSGHNPKILTGDYKLDSDLVKNIGGNVIIQKSYFNKLGFSIMPFFPIWCLLNLKKFDVVHMHVYRTYQNLILYIFCTIFSIPYVVDAHGSVPLYKRKNNIKRLFDYLIGKRILKSASILIAETEVGSRST